MHPRYQLFKEFFPPVTAGIVAVLIAACVLSFQHDRDISKQIHQYYQQHNILDYEAENFRDFLARRLTIDRQGTEAYLSHIEALLETDADDELIDEIIQNREFFTYLVVDGAFFMTPNKYQSWKQARESSLNDQIEQFSDHQFGLKPESYRLADLFTYTTIETSIPLLIINILLLLVVGSYLEYFFGKGRFLALWFGGSLIYGLMYVSLHNLTHPILTGASGPLSLLVGLSIAKLLGDWQKDEIVQSAFQRHIKWLIFGLIIVIGLKLGCELIFLQEQSWRFLVSQIVIYSLGIALFFAARPLIIKQQDQSENDQLDLIDHMRRVEWAKAMDDISSLNFHQAQERLEFLVEEYPNDIDLTGQLYRLAKLDGSSDTYWNCARNLVEAAVEKNNLELAVLLFDDIQKNAATKKLAREKLKATHYHKLMMIFVYHGDMERAEKSFLFLELAGHVNIIKDACLLLMQEYKHRQNLVKSRQYEMLLERL